MINNNLVGQKIKAQKFSRCVSWVMLLIMLFSSFLLSFFSRVSTVGASFPITPPITPPITSPTNPTTPSPIQPNSAPVLVTKVLPEGNVGKSYFVIIFGEDTDIEDTLSMNVSNLPRGLKVAFCSQKILTNPLRKRIACSIKGVPSEVGKFKIGIKLEDSSGNLTEKSLPLVISD